MVRTRRGGGVNFSPSEFPSRQVPSFVTFGGTFFILMVPFGFPLASFLDATLMVASSPSCAQHTRVSYVIMPNVYLRAAGRGLGVLEMRHILLRASPSAGMVACSGAWARAPRKVVGSSVAGSSIRGSEYRACLVGEGGQEP